MNVDTFERKQFSLQFCFSLIQVTYMVQRVSFICCLNAFCPFVLNDSLICFAEERGIGLLVCMWYVKIFISRKNFYPRHLPTPTTHTHDPRPLPGYPCSMTFSYTPFTQVHCRICLLDSQLVLKCAISHLLTCSGGRMYRRTKIS